MSRDKKKADMIALISTALTKRGCHVIQSLGDADVNIVKATVERSCHCTTTILRNKSQEDISDLGKDLIVDLFGGKSNDTLSSLRHIIFIKKVATAQAFVTPERLLPTLPATRFHSQRMYFQIMVWMGMANEINPTELG